MCIFVYILGIAFQKTDVQSIHFFPTMNLDIQYAYCD